MKQINLLRALSIILFMKMTVKTGRLSKEWKNILSKIDLKKARIRYVEGDVGWAIDALGWDKDVKKPK